MSGAGMRELFRHEKEKRNSQGKDPRTFEVNSQGGDPSTLERNSQGKNPSTFKRRKDGDF